MFQTNLHTLLFGSLLLSLGAWFLADKPHITYHYQHYLRDTGDEDSLRKLKYRPNRFSTYNFGDRYGNPFSTKPTKSVLKITPSNLKKEIRVDSSLQNYTIEEKIGDFNYRPPSLMSYDELNNYRQRQIIRDYWRNAGAGVGEETSTSAAKGIVPRIPVNNRLFGLIFGGDYVEFKPTGFVNLDLAYRRQNVANPAIPAARQRNGVFDFDPHANINLVGQVGDKLRITTAFDTKASFDFENNFRVEYTGYPEEIIQKIEFGNINFPLPTSLITGSQNLFGARTELKFGKLRVNSVFSQQRASRDQVVIQGGGAQLRKFEIRATDYEENKHFFLSQFHRNAYEPALRTLPVVNSGVFITRVEVYVTNRTNNTQTLRNVVGFMDLGEAQPHKPANPFVGTGTPNAPASNQANALFGNLRNNAPFRNAETVSNAAIAQNLRRGEDFELLRGARRLEPNEYVFHQQLGYISLNTALRNDEILAVAYEYTLNGQVFRVGELSDDYLNRPQEEVVFLKMLRPSTIRTDLPMWNLMMKNIYPLGATQVTQSNFQLRIVYRDDITGVDNPALQEGANTRNIQLLRIFGLDQLNPRGDRQIDSQGRAIGDGNFDFVEGLTINTANGRVIFPVLEPFGSFLRTQFNAASEQSLINKYVFQELYTGTRNDAQNNFANKNKFFVKGQLEGASGNSAFLPGINVPEGSVIVRAGGIQLTEGQDYVVNYSTGQVNITNEAILASGKEITIDYEKADFFNVQPRTFLGTRFDYAVDKDINIGATWMTLRERPVLTRVNIGSEALNNTMLGVDVALKKDSRFLTRMVDAIPFIQTKEKSTITFNAEAAQLIPDAAALSGAVSFIDDFEGARTPFDLTRTANLRWKLGSTPPLISEFNPGNPLDFNYRRALLAWYNVDNTFYRTGVNGRPNNINENDLRNHYMRPVIPQEIFRNRQFDNIATNETTFDLAFFPEERGPYNYNPNLLPDGRLPNPQANFGAITRAITTEVDFDNANIEFLEFWMLDPFIEGERGRVVVDGENGVNNTTGGDLYFQLGSISEDVMRDSRHFFENGLPITPEGQRDQTAWGNVPRQQYINNAFDNSPGARPLQDVGLDGLSDADETSFFADYINSVTPAARESILNDPSADNFQFYFGADLDARNAKIIERYKYYNNTQNNSPENTGGAFTPSGTNLPDNEDLNGDNTLNELEEYYQYRISLRRQDLVVGRNYIVDKVQVTDNNIAQGDDVNWYLFRIPIRQFDSKVGNIDGFKSIRFARMVMTNFQQPVVARLAQFQFVSSQWRRFLGNLSSSNFQLPTEPNDPGFTVSVVNLEENSAITSDGAIPYDLPPGVVRDRDIASINNRELNEQAIQVCVEGLQDKDARAIFKNTNLNLRFYKRLRMFVHANSSDARDGEMSAIIRLGTDFTENYYEVEIPLNLTRQQDVVNTGNRDARRRLIWPLENELDIAIQDIIDTKVERNRIRGLSNLFIPYSRSVGQYRVTVVGNPDLSAALVVMLGVRNPNIPNDDALPKSACVWFNELRATEFDQTNGYAATARLNVQLADFANITATGSIRTFGFGGLNTRIAEREVATTKQYEVQGTFALDKFLPQKAGLRVPMFVSYQRRNISPEFDPLDPDVRLKRSVDKFDDDGQRDRYLQLVEENETRRSINFTNVRKIKTSQGPSRFYDISNFGFNWAYSDIERSDIGTAQFLQQNWKTGLTYTYTSQVKPWEPFKNSKSKLLNSPWLRLIKDFNLNFVPTSITIRGDLDRTFTRTELRSGQFAGESFEPFFEKYFLFNRSYDLQWNITKALSFNYAATANSIIDEPAGEINTQASRDSVRINLLRLGRMQNFRQNINVNYKVPFDKFPLTDWLSTDLGYRVDYQWTAASFGLADILGNTISNSREQNLRGRLDLVKLYNKVSFLKKVNDVKPAQPARPNPRDTAKVKKSELKVLQGAARVLMMVRSINVTYSLQEGTRLPGFAPSAKYVGFDQAFNAPGWDFILGSQDPNIRFRAEQNGWLVRSDSSLVQNMPFMQNLTENLAIQTAIEPFRDFKIQVDMKRQRSAGFQEIFRYNDTLDVYESLSPVRTGSYQLSMIALGTTFRSSDNTANSQTFREFIAYTEIFRRRLTAQNPNASAESRYDSRSQDVLISAFLSAYTGRDPNTSSLSAFPAIPLPNWRLDYAGLSKVGFLKEIFTTVNITHSYASDYRVANYTSSLEYRDPSLIGLNVNEQQYLNPNLTNLDSLFVPVFVVGQVLLSERLAPLIGINVRTKDNLTVRVDFNKSRDVSLSLFNGQITEIRSDDIVIGLGYSKKNLRLPFKDSNRRNIILKNNLDFRCDFAIRDTKTFQRNFDQEDAVTGGNLNFQLKPNVSYNVDQRLTVQAYFERNINTPAISSSFPRTNTAVGFQVRYNLSQ